MRTIEFLERITKLPVDKETNRRGFFKEVFSLLSNRSIDCPIYTYHEVSNAHYFASSVVNLLQRGWHPIKLEQLYNALQAGEITWPQDKQPFILSFDDGLLSQKHNAFPFLAEWQIPAVFSIMPDWEGDGRHRYMGNDDFKELSKLGMEVISHTFHHPNLPRLRFQNWGAWVAEIVQSRSRLEDIIGTSVDFFCYPFGAYDRSTVEAVVGNYLGALSTRRGSLQLSGETYFLRRLGRS